MTNPTAPRVDCGQHHAGLSVPDIRRAVDYYVRKLGFTGSNGWTSPCVSRNGSPRR